jgi:diaminohydroxyphosphoribosylaminopyrimidine deaminase/5-amino-6-(5-phosphoribosylamino)uracil reductase
MNADADHWMRHALDLAERGRGLVEPNPLVGAVLVKEGRVVGEGWHERFGQAHAEINALRHAGTEARGAMLYVTLEPCCHHGKTPPCTDALIKAGIASVVAAVEDPFPQVAGRGALQLREAGIPIDFGPGADAARRQNASYRTLLSKGRPHVHGKWAMSLDGKIATRTGDSKWISCEASRGLVHELRGRMDGILVGIGTVLADDPLLTARPSGARIAGRVVLDRQARLPPASQLVRTAQNVPTLVAVGEQADAEAIAKLVASGCEIFTLAEVEKNRLDVAALLAELGRRRWTNLLVEGGGEVLASFASAGLLDEVHVFVAPKWIGGRTAPGPLGGLGIDKIADARSWPHVSSCPVGDDIYLRAWL